MAFSVQHTQLNIARPDWYQLEAYADLDKALHRARNYALDHGGYVCVKDQSGKVVYGTDPSALDRAISLGINHNFCRLTRIGRTEMTDRYADICKSYWRDAESDDEHAERIERCTNEANVAYTKAIAGPLAAVRQTMKDIAPYKDSPRWARMKTDAERQFREVTKPSYELFLREFEDLMRDGECSEETSFAWDALFAAQRKAAFMALHDATIAKVKSWVEGQDNLSSPDAALDLIRPVMAEEATNV